MAETSGFFQSVWDPNLTNPITKEDTGWWDRSYLSSEFRNFFSLFIGNGVFISPDNQLKVLQGEGNTIIVTPGWAIINGGFYHNDTDLILTFPVNTGITPRVDTVRLRYSEADREIKAYIAVDDTEIIRGDTVYDLILSENTVYAGSSVAMQKDIVDKRPDETVCGFVKGLLSVVSTGELFAQFQAIFEAWFDMVKGQVSGDLAIRLQQEFDEINAKFEKYKEGYEADFAAYKVEINNYKNEIKVIAETAADTIEDFVSKYFILPQEGTMLLTFTDKQCIITDSRIKADSLVDIYFTSSTIQEAEDCQIYVDSYDGSIVVSATKQPDYPLEAMISVRARA